MGRKGREGKKMDEEIGAQFPRDIPFSAYYRSRKELNGLKSIKIRIAALLLLTGGFADISTRPPYIIQATVIQATAIFSAKCHTNKLNPNTYVFWYKLFHFQNWHTYARFLSHGSPKCKFFPTSLPLISLSYFSLSSLSLSFPHFIHYFRINRPSRANLCMGIGRIKESSPPTCWLRHFPTLKRCNCFGDSATGKTNSSFSQSALSFCLSHTDNNLLSHLCM